MKTFIKISILSESKESKELEVVGEYISNSEDSNVYESRAKDLANIMAYDHEHYCDVNIETILRAAEVAGIIEIEKNR